MNIDTTTHLASPDLLNALQSRRSVPSRQLGSPGPDEATLLRMLQAAVRVPDHGKLVPFRFLRISGDARHALGELLAARTWTGQTTNFRTPGGGFSPVVVLPAVAPASAEIHSTPHSTLSIHQALSPTP